MEPGVLRDAAGRSFWVYKTYMQPEVNLDPDSDPLALEPEFSPEPDMEQDPLDFSIKQEPGVKQETTSPRLAPITWAPRLRNRSVNIGIKSESSSPTKDVEINSNEDDILCDTESAGSEPSELHSSMPRDPNFNAVLPTNVEEVNKHDITSTSYCSKIDVNDLGVIDKSVQHTSDSAFEPLAVKYKLKQCFVLLNFCPENVAELPNVADEPSLLKESLAKANHGKLSLNFSAPCMMKFKCDICPKHFTNLGHLKQHEESHIANKVSSIDSETVLQMSSRKRSRDIINCDISGKVFSELDGVRGHKATRHTGNSEPFKCVICFHECGDIHDMRKHEHRHLLNPLTCLTCLKVFITVHELMQHSKLHDNICDDSFPTSAGLTERKSNTNRNTSSDLTDSNVSTHGTRKSVSENHCECQFCNESTAELVNHGNVKPDKPFPCKLCSLSYRCTDSLLRHVRSIHLKIKHTCDKCQKTFTQRASLVRHKIIHSNPFKCDLCQKGFGSKIILEVHLFKLHFVGEYKCQFCNKLIGTKRQLRIHETRHSKRYACDACNVWFGQKSDLRRHLEIHAEKTHQCDVCGKMFSSIRNLVRHRKDHDRSINKKAACVLCKKEFLRKDGMQRHIRLKRCKILKSKLRTAI